jgi:hypothetical protein
MLGIGDDERALIGIRKDRGPELYISEAPHDGTSANVQRTASICHCDIIECRGRRTKERIWDRKHVGCQRLLTLKETLSGGRRGSSWVYRAAASEMLWICVQVAHTERDRDRRVGHPDPCRRDFPATISILLLGISRNLHATFYGCRLTGKILQAM